MQREILFKAKRKDNGLWVIGLPRYMNYKRLKNGTMFVDGIEDQEGYVWEVDPETVCQYIGENDQDNSKAFLGDILFWNYSKYVIDFLDSGLIAMCLTSKDYHYLINIIHESQVIGNIHDKKEG